MTKRLLCILVAMGALLAGTAQGQTTTISDETQAAAGELTSEQAAEVEAFITFCAERMTDPASDINVIKSCRESMISAYGGDLGEGFMRHFARATEQVFVPATLRAEQSPVVQVNGAMVIAEIARPELASLLTRMLTHPNAAVRYYALKGFQRIVPAMVAMGEDEFGEVFKALREFAQRTADPALVRVLLRAMDLSELDADRVNPATLNDAREEAMKIIMQLLEANLQAIRDGDAGMADAAAFGVNALAGMGLDLPKEEREDPLKAVAAVAANAGEAFGELSLVDDDGNQRLVRPPGSFTMLLVYCERAIGKLIGQRKVAISRELPPTQASDVTRALLAVNGLVGASGTEGDLQKLDVVDVPVPTRLSRSPEAAEPGR
ncbi:MAG: HEAT repeat domain-containing protein [Planctomycetota bacterium]